MINICRVTTLFAQVEVLINSRISIYLLCHGHFSIGLPLRAYQHKTCKKSIKFAYTYASKEQTCQYVGPDGVTSMNEYMVELYQLTR